MTVLCRAALAAAAIVCCVAWPSPAASTWAAERTAGPAAPSPERVLRRHLLRRGLAAARLRCRPRISPRAPLVCGFRARDRLGRRCSGRSRTRLTAGRWRARVGRLGCRAPAKRPAPPAPPLAFEPPPPAHAPLYGFTDNSVGAGQLSAAAAAELNRQAGAEVVRLTLDWRWLEPFEGDYRWAPYDEMYREYLAAGVRPVFTLLFSPWWTWEPSIVCDQWHQDCTYPPAASHDDDWSELAELVARRYPLAAGIEVWNEPNLHWFWRPRPDAARYAELQRLAYEGVKRVRPAMPVVMGGINNNPTTTALDDSLARFVEHVYAHGGGETADALNIHPYPFGLDQRFFLESFRLLREVRDRHGDAAKPIWVTEFGISTTGTDPLYVFTPEDQARGLVEHVRTMSAMPDVELIALYTLVEPRGWRGVFDPRDPDVGRGIVDRRLVPKPAWCALLAERGRPCRG
jgi:polysaccharide biosynthesis protein PslG